jgi:Ice-binding-like
MNSEEHHSKHWHLTTFAYRAGCVCLATAFALTFMSGFAVVAVAAPLGATAPGLGAAATFSIIGKAGVTNTGASTISGDIGADLLAAISGFGSATVGGSFIAAPAVNQAEADVSAADLALTSQGPGTSVGPNLTGLNLGPGVYAVGSALLPGVLTLNGPGVFIFLVASDLTASGSIHFINGAAPCNVFWHVTSNAVITGGPFAGNIIAGNSVTFGSGASLNGRAFAKIGNVTLIDNNIGGPSCAPVAPTSTPTVTPTLLPGQPSPTPLPLPTATAIPIFPSYVSVTYPCSTDGTHVVVTVGLSAGVIVYGLGDDITSATDTGPNGRIIRILPFGHYDWHAVPPPNHYMVDVAAGAIDPVVCPSTGPGGATAAPTGATASGPTETATAGPSQAPSGGPTAVATAGPSQAPSGGPTAAPVLIAATGADLAQTHALAARQLLQGGLGFLGLGLVLVGVALWRKRVS